MGKEEAKREIVKLREVISLEQSPVYMKYLLQNQKISDRQGEQSIK